MVVYGEGRVEDDISSKRWQGNLMRERSIKECSTLRQQTVQQVKCNVVVVVVMVMMVMVVMVVNLQNTFFTVAESACRWEHGGRKLAASNAGVLQQPPNSNKKRNTHKLALAQQQQRLWPLETDTLRETIANYR